MKTDTRRVYTFITLGLIAAVIVGVAVWFAGIPASPSASDTATQTPEVSTLSESTQTGPTNPPADEGADEDQPQVVAAPETDDPFLAPNAVVQAAPQSIAPTVVYRPQNILPQGNEQNNVPAEPVELVDETTSAQVPSFEEEIIQDSTRPATTEPTEPTEPTELPATEESTSPADPTDPLEGVDPIDLIVPADPAVTAPEVIEPTAPAQLTQPSDNADNSIDDDANGVTDTDIMDSTPEAASPKEEATVPSASWSSWPRAFRNWFD